MRQIGVPLDAGERVVVSGINVVVARERPGESRQSSKRHQSTFQSSKVIEPTSVDVPTSDDGGRLIPRLRTCLANGNTVAERRYHDGGWSPNPEKTETGSD